MGLGDLKSEEWLNRHPDQIIDPRSRPGYLWDVTLTGANQDRPANIPAYRGAWTPVEDWKARNPTGWTRSQILVGLAPFMLGAGSALAGIGGAAGGGGAAAGGGAGLSMAPLSTLPISATAAAAGIPAGSLAAGGAAAAGGAGAAAGGGGFIGSLIANGAPQVAAGGGMDWLTLGQLGLGGVNMLRNRGGGNSAGPLDGELRKLLQMQTGRMQQQQPLYDAIQQLAMYLMPQMSGGGAPGVPQAPQPGARPR